MSKKILIYTEGKSDRNFLGRYLNFLKCEDRFDIFDIEGKDKLILGEFPEIIEKILKNKHQTYKQVCIIFDADKKESQESDAGFDNKLEHICEKLKEKGIDFPREQIKKIRKNMLYAYLEAFGLEKFFSLTTKMEMRLRLKDQYKEDYKKLKEVIDFDSKSLVPLKNFLGQFAKNNQK